MTSNQRILFCSSMLLLIAVFAGPAWAESAAWVFQLRVDPRIQTAPYTGRVYVFFSKPGPQAIRSEPRFGPGWFHPQPLIGFDVEGWKPGEILTIDFADPRTLTLPRNLRPGELEGLQAQAVVRLNPFEREVGEGPGNGYGPVVALGSAGQVDLRIDQLVPEQEFIETDWTKLLRVRSARLSEFHHRDLFLSAAVTLPGSYLQEPQRRYPVILEVPGFGGTLHHGRHQHPVKETNTAGVEFIRVMLDPSCPLGHHVFANSANNGPYGDALVEELLPALDAAFRTIAEPQARFLTGHSSGGWSTLWLQATYPDQFGGTWSTAPDPVDFRDFQRINLYQAGENMFVDAQGQRRPIARRGAQPAIYYDDFSRMEEVLGYGGQLHSFEAVFSPRGADGRPELLFDRRTGAIDPSVAKAWERYDIRLLLERNWDTLAPRLRGKIQVYMGSLDTFYLEGATALLKRSLEQLGSDAVVEMIPDRDHSNLFEGGLHERIEQEMAERFLAHRERFLQKP